MTWREIERELIEFFERHGVEVINDGDKHVMLATGWSVSLTTLAQKLRIELSQRA